MRTLILGCIGILFGIGAASCHDKAKDYKDVMREGTWYVYDIDSDYKFYTFMSPGLKRYVRYLMDEKNLLFLPGDEIVFSSKHVNVRTPGNVNYSYRYYFQGKYVKIGDYDVYYGFKPDGDQNWLNLEFDKSSLRQLLADQGEEGLLDEVGNLKNFHITYLLQRPQPLFAQIISGIYQGELYDGTEQLINGQATLNLFWENNFLNLSMDEQVILQGGPKFYLEVPALQVSEGFTPGSYDFAGNQVIDDPVFGRISVVLKGRYHVAETVSVEIAIEWNGLTYLLNYFKGVRQWVFETANAEQTARGISLQALPLP